MTRHTRKNSEHRAQIEGQTKVVLLVQLSPFCLAVSKRWGLKKWYVSAIIVSLRAQDGDEIAGEDAGTESNLHTKKQ